jgi:hypothetical protein
MKRLIFVLLAMILVSAGAALAQTGTTGTGTGTTGSNAPMGAQTDLAPQADRN